MSHGVRWGVGFTPLRATPHCVVHAECITSRSAAPPLALVTLLQAAVLSPLPAG